MQRIDIPMWCKHQECSLQAASSAASDIWSLGILLFELATGHLPFPGKLKRQVDSANELTDQERDDFFQSVATSISLQKVQADSLRFIQQHAVTSIVTLLCSVCFTLCFNMSSLRFQASAVSELCAQLAKMKLVWLS